jgi:hypothetical protein
VFKFLRHININDDGTDDLIWWLMKFLKVGNKILTWSDMNKFLASWNTACGSVSAVSAMM